MPGPLNPFGALAQATRSAYPGEFDGYSDAELAQAVHKAYPGEFSDYDDPGAGLELLSPPPRVVDPDAENNAAVARLSKRLGRPLKVAPRTPATGVPPPPTFLGSPAYEPAGGSIPMEGVAPSGQVLGAVGKAIGRPVETTDPFHALGAGPRATYGYLESLRRGMPLNKEQAAMEEAQRGTVDYGTLSEDALAPYAYAAAGQLAEWGVPLSITTPLALAPFAVNMGISTLTDPTAYTGVGLGLTKFPRYLAGWMSGQNAIRSIERQGLERLATELPGVEARAAASMATHPSRVYNFRGGPLYEAAARADVPMVPGVPRGTGAVAPPPQVIGPERQLQPPIIRAYPPGVEPTDPSLGSPAGDVLGRGEQAVGDPQRFATSTYPEQADAPDPLLNEFEQTLASQLESQPPTAGRLYGTPGYRLQPPPQVAGEALDDDLPVQRGLWRGRRPGAPDARGAGEPLVRGPETPFPESAPGQGVLDALHDEPLPQGPFPKSHEYGDDIFKRADAATTRQRLMPSVRRELQRILDEFDAQPYQENVWTPADPNDTGWTGNAGGGHWNVAAGHAGAPVYNDILGFSPVQRLGAGGPTATRKAVYRHIEKLLKTGKIDSSVQEGALRVAERRAGNDYSQLSRPIVAPWWDDVPLPNNAVDDMGRTLDDVPFDIPEGELSPEDAARAAAEGVEDIPRRQYNVDPRLGQAPLEPELKPGETHSPRYNWKAKRDEFFKSEEGSDKTDYDALLKSFGKGVSERAARINKLIDEAFTLRYRPPADMADVEDAEAQIGATITRESNELRQEILRGGLSDDPATRVRQLEALSTDAAMGVRADGSEQSHWGNPHSESTTICTHCADRVLSFLPNQKGKMIAGWEDGTNPTAKAAADMGHDFAIYEGRYLIDPWAMHVEQTVPKAAFDLDNPADAALVKNLYGDPRVWTRVRENEAPVPRAIVQKVLKASDVTPPPRAIQQRLPGEVGDVQDLEVPTPTEDLPFSLTSEVAKPAKPRSTKGLFDDFFADESGEVDVDKLRAAMAQVSPESVGKWLKQYRSAFKQEDWYRKAAQLYSEGKPYEAHREVLLAQRAMAKRAAGMTAREIAGEDRTAARKTAADLRTEAKAIVDSDTPPWAHPEVKEEKIIPRAYAKAVEEDPSLADNAPKVMRPPLRGPLPDIADVDRELGSNIVTDILKAGTDAGVLDDLAQPYSVATGRPWKKDQKLKLFRQIADRLLRAEGATGQTWRENLAQLRILKDNKLVPIEQVARWWANKYSNAGRTLGELGNWQQARKKAGQIVEDWIEPRFGDLGDDADAAVGLTKTARQLGMTDDEIATLGQRRNRLGRFVKEDEGAVVPGAPPSAEHLMKDVIWGKTGGAGRYAQGQPGGLGNEVENLSRGIITSQLPTAERNLWTATGRYAVGGFDELLASQMSMLRGDPAAAKAHWAAAKRLARAGNTPGVVPRRPWTDTLEDIYAFNARTLETAKGKALKVRDARRSLAVLDQFSRRQDVRESIALTFLGDATAGEAEAGARTKGPKWLQKALSPEVRNRIATANRMQEYTMRATVFDAAFRAELDRLGFDTDKLLTQDFADIAVEVGPEKLEDALRAATYTALDFTFAAGAYPGSIADHVLSTISKHWWIRTGYPFPRFNFVSAPRFLYDHSPVALFEILPTMAYKMGLTEKPVGRLAKGLAAANLRDHALPKLANQKRVLQAGHEVAWLEYKQRTLQSRALAKEFRNLERQHLKGRLQPNLPGGSTLDDRLTEIGERMGALEEAKITARQKIASTRKDLEEVTKTSRQLRSTIDKAKRASLPDFDQYVARVSTGLGLLGAAWVMRSSPGAKGTEWYEYRVKMPEAMGGRTVNMDFRAFAPFAQYLFVADVMEDLRTGIDWELQDRLWKGTDPDQTEKMNYYQAMRHAYDGKRSFDEFGKDFVEAFLSISRAAGATLSLSDLITGRQTSKGKLQDVAEYVIGAVGQFIGRFTVPLRQVTDLDALINPEAEVARIPEETPMGYLAGPTIANIPRVREQIPPKISATTGEPIATMYPTLRTLTGITMRVRRPLEVEMKTLGMNFSDATPRQTGERELDNQIATAYSKLLARTMPRVLNNPRIKALPIAARRSVYKSIFSRLKGAAYAKVQMALSKGEDAEGRAAVRDKLAKPGEVQQRQYWKRLLRKRMAEEAPPEAEEPDTPTGVEPPPQVTEPDEPDEESEDDFAPLPEGIQ